MNELDALRRLRNDLPEPRAKNVARSRERLLMEIRASGGAKRPEKAGRRLSRTGLLIAITALISLPSGFAIAEVLNSDDEITPGGFLDRADCPEATAAFEAAGMPGFSESFVASDGCPTMERVNEIIRVIQADQQRLEEWEARQKERQSP